MAHTPPLAGAQATAYLSPLAPTLALHCSRSTTPDAHSPIQLALQAGFTFSRLLLRRTLGFSLLDASRYLALATIPAAHSP